MKRFLSIFVLCLYLVTSIGITITAHYCGGDLASIGFFSKTFCCCEEKLSKKKNGCCKDQQMQVKLSDDQQKVEQNFTCLHIADLQLPLKLYTGAQTHPTVFYSDLHLTALPRPPDTRNSLPMYTRCHSLLFYS